MRFRKPLVSVTWEDAHGVATGDYTEEEIADFHRPAIYTAVGLLVRDDATGVTLASEQSETGFRGMSFIPRGMVREVQGIKHGGVRQRRAIKREEADSKPMI